MPQQPRNDEGGLRILGAPLESVVLRLGFYHPRSLTLNQHGEAFFPFCLLDDGEAEDVGLGRDQLLVDVAWAGTRHGQRIRLERERGRVLNARSFSTDSGGFFIELERPPFACDPEIELIPIWKPWAGWQSLPCRDSAADTSSAWLRADASLEPGPYLCTAVDVSSQRASQGSLPASHAVTYSGYDVAARRAAREDPLGRKPSSG